MTTTRSLPDQPSIESLRKQAKTLHRAVASGDEHAIARVRHHIPDADTSLSRRDAQLVIAREFGFPGWNELKHEVARRAGEGIEWAAVQTRRAIHDNDLDALRQLLAAYPGLLVWQDEDDNEVLLQATSSYANDASADADLFNRTACAEVLIDAGAVTVPAVWERAIDTGSSRMLAMLERKGVVPHTLDVLAALGDVAALRACFTATGDVRAEARPSGDAVLAGAADRTLISAAFTHACRFGHAQAAPFLLEQCTARDHDLRGRIDCWGDRGDFVRYFLNHAAEMSRFDLNDAQAPGDTWPALWRLFTSHRLMRAMHEQDFEVFASCLDAESDVLGAAELPLQVRIIEIACYSRGCGQYIKAMLDRGAAVLSAAPPPASRCIEFAIEYGNASLVPMLSRIWNVPDDLPHAAGLGDQDSVRQWFDRAGAPVLGNPRAHHPGRVMPGRATVQWTLDYAIAWACMNRQFDVAEYLLEHGADINTRWSTHEPASILHECAMHANYETATWLIGHDIDMTLTDHRWQSDAAGWARYGAGDEAMAEFLEAAMKAKGL